MTYPKSKRTPFSDAEVHQLGGYLTASPHLYDETIHRLYARLVRTEERLTKAEDGAVEESHAYNGLLDDYRAEIAKAEALASKVAAVERLRYDDTDDGNQYEHIPGYCGVGCSGCWAENIGRALGKTGGTEEEPSNDELWICPCGKVNFGPPGECTHSCTGEQR